MTEPTDVSSIPSPSYGGGQVGPGRSIRKAREAAGLSLEELATQMRLARATLDALERDDFSTLSEPVYIRGYYRKCAKALNLPETDLIAGYERLAAPKAPPPPTKLLLANSNARADHGRRPGLRWLLVLLLAMLIGAVLFLSTRSDLVHPQQKTSEADPAVGASVEPTPEPLKAESSSAPPANESSSSAGIAPAPPASVSSAAATSSEADAKHEFPPAPTSLEAPKSAEHLPPAAAVQNPVAESATKPGSLSGLSLHFRGTSWVRVQDATGKTLLSGVVENGEQQTVSGLPPYSVFLGNAPVVDVEYEGQAIKLDTYVKGNSTARFSVPAVPSSP